MTTINQFNLEDQHILQSYYAVVDGISALIGPHCEIVLHSFEDLEHSAVYIANGHNTHRKIGSPMTDLALKSLHKMQDGGKIEPYFTKAKGNCWMKSITVPIRNGIKIIGLLCININLDVPYSQILDAFTPKNIPETAVNFASSVEELVSETIEKTVEEVSANLELANNNKNRHIVLSLFEKGIFNIKDAINLVAERLNISRHTVYLYIRQIKQEQED